jgi:hypothetical protein
MGMAAEVGAMLAKIDTPAATTADVEDTDIAHLAGFIDGAGVVTVDIIKHQNYKIGYSMEPVVRVSRGNHEDLIFGKLAAYCDENAIRYRVEEKSHGEGKDTTSTEFKINKPDDVRRFLEPMMDYLVSKFVQANGLLQLIPELENDTHRSEEGFYQLMELVDEIRSHNLGPNEGKYDQEFFADEFSISQ